MCYSQNRGQREVPNLLHNMTLRKHSSVDKTLSWQEKTPFCMGCKQASAFTTMGSC